MKEEVKLEVKTENIHHHLPQAVHNGEYEEVVNEDELVDNEPKLEDSEEFLRGKPEIVISNVVSNFRCRCHLNLRTIASKNKDVIYKR